MKKFDIIKPLDISSYKKLGINDESRGIVYEILSDGVNAIFFNPHNTGEAFTAFIENNNFKKEELRLPDEIIAELNEKIDVVLKKSKSAATPLPVKAYDRVELITDSAGYAKFGIKKGMRGVVMDDYAVQNCVEVDFSVTDENGEEIGDCISVNVKHLKVLSD